MVKPFAGLMRRLARNSDAHDEEPIRAEIFSVERLEQFAATLAAKHKEVRAHRYGRKLLPELEENGHLLLSAYRSLAEAIRRERTISPAAEWFVDNFHIIEEQLREVREDLPRGFYYELPKLERGLLSGYPRIYALARALIAHTDSRLDTDTLKRFIRAYQQVTPLTIGELWAVAIVLRLALVKNLRRLATRIVAARVAREEADALADELLEMVARGDESLTQLLRGRLGRREDIDRAFVVQLTQRLREQDPAVMPVFDWLEQQLGKKGLSIEQVVHIEHQRQAAAQVTVGNIITSMRLLSTLDWRDFFESVSLVDSALGEDPAGLYARMTFATRDHYRHVVERISKRTAATELEVAQGAVRLAAESKESNPGDEARAHVGYYLVDDGVDELAQKFNYRPSSPRERTLRVILRHPTPFYLGTLASLTCLFILLLVLFAHWQGAGTGVVVLLALLSLIPASELVLNVINWDVTHLLPPRLLPSLDTSSGIPPEAQTMVVVPTIFRSEEVVKELLENLEVNYLANRDENLYYALLGDFTDAPQEEMPGDDSLIEITLEGIMELNRRYEDGSALQRFHLFHRRRKWNEGEGKWLGWERKRGKLQEFNRLLRGARDTSFIIATADSSELAQIRYVITLDSDTRLPRDAARRLVGIALHPLNRPQYDARAERVTRGYGILQPRVSVALESAARSRFARIFAGNTGVDPYTTAASDVYQDLFGEGSFTGKGLYEVDTFERALEGRVPEYSLLSHDLFEGLYARTGLVSDVELLDDYPTRYDTHAMRLHRWTRGDWQIALWILSRVPDAQGRPQRNRLPLISRWKILDNLRRSLLSPSIVLWLLFAWTFFPGPPALWTLFILLVLAFPVYSHATTNLTPRRRGIPLRSHFRDVWIDLKTNTAQVALSLTFLAHHAYLMVDAITRTLYRKLVSRRDLLEWMTAAQAEKGGAQGISAFFRFMWPAEMIVIIIAALIMRLRPGAMLAAIPFLLAWAISPLIAYWVSSSRAVTEQEKLSETNERQARLIARRTWRFFETFVGQEDQWLPPDNFQEDPRPVVAHRTSPTNIGLLLLSTVAAHDFGYLGTLELLERLELTFATMEKLPRFRGHFFNWYDTRTLETLPPQYISTVDSGNLAGHLVTLKQSCLEIFDLPLFDARTLAGFADTLALMREETERLGAFRQQTEVVTVKQLREEIEECARIISVGPPETLSAWASHFDALARHTAEIEDILGALAQEHGTNNFTELHFWLTSLMRQTQASQRDLQHLTPVSVLQRQAQNHMLVDGVNGEALTQLNEILQSLDRVSSIATLADAYENALINLAALKGAGENNSSKDVKALPSPHDWIASVEKSVENGLNATRGVLSRLSRMAKTCERIFEEMDFKFLLDEERRVFVIGYNVSAGRPDNSYYDLLASEVRLGSFIAIAKGDALQEHWFRLGRQLTPVDSSRALISWTGSMFEYLMPLLVMRDYDKTLLDQTYKAVIERQIEYGAERGVPWGISESAYNARDLQLNYQYGPFGVPGLGLKRGLSEDLVIAPYATMLAAMVSPVRAVANLRRLEQEVGALARYGFYEAIDYTPERVPQGQKQALVYAFMAHHQGMSLLALDNVINDSVMQKRFHSDPLVQATELLLQERIPRNVSAAHPRAEEVLSGRVVRTLTGMLNRVYDTADLPTPRVQLLSNGTYSVMLTSSGSGYSNCRGLAVTRWREDPTRDHWGNFFYLRDVRSGAVWSAGFQPICQTPRIYKVSFSEDKVDFWRNDAGTVTHTEVIVSPEDDAEVRRISITNQSTRVREIEVTSYAEIVLAPPAADLMHPAFSNLFIETEFVPAKNTLLARRRPRSSKDESAYAVHVIVMEGESIGAVQFETDRSRFLGRGRSAADPIAVMEDRPLSNTVGAVLDPVFSLRQRLRIEPGQTVRVSFTTAFARSREQALALADKYHDPSAFTRAAHMAWTQAQVEMRHHNIDLEEAFLFQRLAGRVLYSDPSLRPRPHVLMLNTKTQSSLWAYGISGDLPIVIVRISQPEDFDTVRRILRGHEYLRLKGLQIDLVILNDHPTTYLQGLQDELVGMIQTSGSAALQDKPGGVFLRRTDIMPEADRILLHAVARVVIVPERGSLETQLTRREPAEMLPIDYIPRAPSHTYPEPLVEVPELAFFNGLGGFAHGGREYVTVLRAGQWTPAPWTNVIANEHDFGFQVTETGSGYTWSVNSRENRLTPWSNDAVSDPPGDIIYLRDEESGVVWSVTPLPIREENPYIVRHGQGYTVFEHTSHGVSQELLLFVPLDAPVKISVLRLRNRTDQRRRLSATSYRELVLGVDRGGSAPHVITEIDEGTQAIFARNLYNNEFAGRIVFADTSTSRRTITCDRKEFLGRNGNPSRPASMRRTQLSGRIGAGLDPCAAMQTIVELAPGETREIVFLLGEAASKEEAREIVKRFRQLAVVNQAFDQVVAYWDKLIETIQVRTPDAAMDIMLNRWLLYQTAACRVLARSAFYQSGGAYGFRDQLQDVMALIYSRPDMARAQILLAASHQFKEGDVQHWWHPPTGRGVRTRISDDLLWLPFVTSFYLDVTNDNGVLDEMMSFLDAPLLAPAEDEAYLQPVVSNESGNLYEHCVRALDRSLAVGVHGLPLMGSGDWNDGMNRVGNQGRGESVWIGWFLYATLSQFAFISEARGDNIRAATYRAHTSKLKQALENEAWDGNWYRRAYFDDGTPLGSAQNEECRIDSIVQSWGVISGAAEAQRAHRAMAAVEEYLVLRGDGLIILFTPPFDKSPLDPGYIKGYVPGVRENGGQYTHAALWTVIAYALLGEGDRAGELFGLLNPINHSSTRAGLHKYKVEPYTAAADVYAVWPHTGRGGWTWYTGSASWMYRAGLEYILGFELRGERLRINPCIQQSWPEYEIAYRYGSTHYSIKVENPNGVNRGVIKVEMDGEVLPSEDFPLKDDGVTHNIRIVLGVRSEPANEIQRIEAAPARSGSLQ
jgi:cyclic beta-1,2-glucan synthetase